MNGSHSRASRLRSPQVLDRKSPSRPGTNGRSSRCAAMSAARRPMSPPEYGTFSVRHGRSMTETPSAEPGLTAKSGPSQLREPGSGARRRYTVPVPVTTSCTSTTFADSSKPRVVGRSSHSRFCTSSPTSSVRSRSSHAVTLWCGRELARGVRHSAPVFAGSTSTPVAAANSAADAGNCEHTQSTADKNRTLIDIPPHALYHILPRHICRAWRHGRSTSFPSPAKKS